MERLRTEQPKGLNRAGLRRWGMVFLVLGVFGRSILQNYFLGIADMSNQQLIDAMSGSTGVMVVVTVALILQFAECCAVPFFCLLAAEGMAHTTSAEKYLARVLGVAVLSEIPYNFAMSGKLLDVSCRNPVFGLALALLLLYLYKRFDEGKPVYLLYKIAFTIATIFWVSVLKIESGMPCFILTLVFWFFRRKLMVRNLMAGCAAMLCSLYSIFYMAAPMSMLILHFYNGTKEEDENRMVNYLFYPAVLTLMGIAGALGF